MYSLYGRLKELCDYKGITGYRMCSDLGISKSLMTDLKSGRKKSVNAETAAKIANYFNVPVDCLLGKMDFIPELCELAQQKVTHDNLDVAIKEKSRSEKRDEMIDRIAIEAKGRIPIVGTIRAGLPLIAEEFLEGWAYSPIKNTDNEIEYFYLRVTGDSMIGAGIEEGSLVLIHKQPYAENGQIVACMVNEEDATLKRFRQQGNTIMLIPENPKYDPIVLSASDFDPDHGTAYIIGVAKQVTIDL